MRRAGATGQAPLFERALARIPGGVDSPVRSFASVGGEPFFVARGEGAYLFDTDGRRYLDYVQSWGASILGHAHPEVVEAVQRAAADGTSYGAPTAREVELAEAIAGRGAVGREGAAGVVGHRGGDDRGAPRTRRDRPREDPEVRRAATTATSTRCSSPRAAASPRSASPGRPASPRAPSPTPSWSRTTTTPRSTRRSPSSGAELAAVIVEPVAANMGLVPPAPASSKGCGAAARDVRRAARAATRSSPASASGRAGAQGLYGVTPDLSMFGKVVGGGLPLAALGGRADVMDELAPLGPVYQAGTLSGNPLATAAGLAVLAAARRRRLRRARRARVRVSPTACATRSAPSARRRRSRRWPPSPACSSHRRPSRTTTRPRPPTTSATRASSTRSWMPAPCPNGNGRVPPAQRLRDALREPRPWRPGARSHRGRGRHRGARRRVIPTSFPLGRSTVHPHPEHDEEAPMAVVFRARHRTTQIGPGATIPRT